MRWEDEERDEPIEVDCPECGKPGCRCYKEKGMAKRKQSIDAVMVALNAQFAQVVHSTLGTMIKSGNLSPDEQQQMELLSSAIRAGIVDYLRGI